MGNLQYKFLTMKNQDKIQGEIQMDIKILQSFIKEFGESVDKKFHALKHYKKVYMLDKSQYINSTLKWVF